MNTVAVLSGFLAFLALGYWSFIRVLFKQQFGTPLPPPNVWLSALVSQQASSYISKSHLFLSIPTISFLLYWGWGPALLWLSISYLLIETPANFLFTRAHDTSADKKRVASLFSESLCYLFLIGLTALVVVFLGYILYANISIGFALIAIIFALFTYTKKTVFSLFEKVFIGILAILLGTLLTLSLRLSLTGSWTPFPTLANWLSFNEANFVTIAVLALGIWLSNQRATHHILSRLVSLMIIGLVILMIVGLGWQQPTLQTPALGSNLPTSERLSAPPNFITIFFLFFIISINILYQSIVSKLVTSKKTDARLHFVRTQVANIVILLFGLGCLLWLASSTIAPSWYDRYTNWQQELNLKTHFNWVLDALFSASTTSLTTATTWQLTGLTVVVNLLGFCSLLTLIKLLENQRRILIESYSAIATTPRGNFINGLAKRVTHRYTMYLAIILLAMWLQHFGIDILIWVLLMVFAWVLASYALLNKVSRLPANNLMERALHGFAIGFFFIGIIQTGIFLAGSINTQNWLYTTYIAMLMLISIGMCARGLWNSFTLLKNRKEIDLLT